MAWSTTSGKGSRPVFRRTLREHLPHIRTSKAATLPTPKYEVTTCEAGEQLVNLGQWTCALLYLNSRLGWFIRELAKPHECGRI
jgi:hypothetical protein